MIMATLRRMLFSAGPRPSTIEFVGFMLVGVLVIPCLVYSADNTQDGADAEADQHALARGGRLHRSLPDQSRPSLLDDISAYRRAATRIRAYRSASGSDRYAHHLHRSVRQVSSSAHTCHPLPNGVRLRSALETIGILTREQCQMLSVADRFRAYRGSICSLVNRTCALSAALDGEMEPSMSGMADNDTVNDTLSTPSKVTIQCMTIKSTIQVACTFNISEGPDIIFFDHFPTLTKAMDEITPLLSMLNTSTALDQSLADEQLALTDIAAVRQSDTAWMRVLLEYDHSIEVLNRIKANIPFCTVAFPPCSISGEPLQLFAARGQECRTPGLFQALLYPATYPEVPRTDRLIPLLVHDQCLTEQRTQVTLNCFRRVPNTTGRGPPVVFSCPEPLQQTDDQSHWIPGLEELTRDVHLDAANAPLDNYYFNNSFPCGRACRVEGYTDSEAKALKVVESISVYVGMLCTLAALIMACLNHKTMFSYPKRLFIYLNLAYFLSTMAYLPAVSVDVIPYLCYSDRTLRTDNFKDSPMCVYTFIMWYGFGLVLISVNILIAISWFRLARFLRSTTPSFQKAWKQLAFEMVFIGTGVAACIVGVAVLLSKDDGLGLALQTGVCTVASKYSLYALEIPSYVAAVLEFACLLGGAIQVVSIRRRSITFRRASHPIGKCNVIKTSLNRVIHTLLLYVVILFTTSLAWALTALASRLGGKSNSALFDATNRNTCTIISCGNPDCFNERVAGYVVAGDFIFALLIGISGVIYSTWVLQPAIWRPQQTNNKVLNAFKRRMRRTRSSNSFGTEPMTTFSETGDSQMDLRARSNTTTSNITLSKTGRASSLIEDMAVTSSLSSPIVSLRPDTELTTSRSEPNLANGHRVAPKEVGMNGSVSNGGSSIAVQYQQSKEAAPVVDTPQ